MRRLFLIHGRFGYACYAQQRKFYNSNEGEYG
jgi:hypothetical protein